MGVLFLLVHGLELFFFKKKKLFPLVCGWFGIFLLMVLLEKGLLESYSKGISSTSFMG